MCFCYILYEPLSFLKDVWEFIRLNSTIFALIVAFFSPWIVFWINNKPKKSKLVLKGTKIVNQNGNIHGRLIIKNEGKYIAKSVEVFIERIQHKGKFRDNFFPVPLAWTHKGEAVRDIYPHQTVYLDFLINKDGRVLFVLKACHGVEDLWRVDPGESESFIKFYQESGQVDEGCVKVILDDKDRPKIDIINFKVVK